MLALMLMALSGTLFIYQGQEIGMVNFGLEWGMEEYKDVATQNYCQLYVWIYSHLLLFFVIGF